MQAVTAFDKDATDVTFFFSYLFTACFHFQLLPHHRESSRATSRFSSAMKIQDEHDNSQR